MPVLREAIREEGEGGDHRMTCCCKPGTSAKACGKKFNNDKVPCKCLCHRFVTKKVKS